MKPHLTYAQFQATQLPDFDTFGYAEWGKTKLSLDGEIGIYEGDCMNVVWIRFGKKLAAISKELARGHLKVVE